MPLNDLLDKLPFLQRLSSVLVCEVDHMGLRAAVVNRHGDALAVVHETSVEQQDFHAAVVEVVTYMRQQGWQGKTAILLTPAVLLAMLDLPIPQNNKLSPEQLAESINWEIEPLITQHLGTLALGRVLVALGYMTAEQVEDVISQQSESNNTHTLSPTETFTYKRFGEVAVEMGYVTPQQLQKCLDSQGWFQSSGDEVKCGWSAQGKKVNADASEKDIAQYQWLAAAVNQTLLRQWQAAFAANGMKLEYLYPLLGCAISTIDFTHKGSKHQLLLEAHESGIAGVHVADNHVQNLHLQVSTLHDTLINVTETYHVLDSAEFDAVWFVDSVTKNEIEASKLVTNLEHLSPWPMHVLPKPSHWVSLGMMGAARHVMNMKGAHTVTGVPVSNPKPKLLQRPEVRAVLAGFLLLFAIGVIELVLQVRQGFIEAENEKISQELKVIDAAVARVQAKINEVNKLKDEIKKMEADKAKNENAVNLINVDLPKRNQTVLSFLSELHRTVNEDVVIDRMTEDTISGFSISAWALNDIAAQEFIKTFQVAVQPLGYKLKNITVTQQTGRLGLLGFAINFEATQLDDSGWNAAKSISRLR